MAAHRTTSVKLVSRGHDAAGREHHEIHIHLNKRQAALLKNSLGEYLDRAPADDACAVACDVYRQLGDIEFLRGLTARYRA